MKLPIASQPVVFVSVPAVFSLTAILTAKSQHEAQRKTVLTCIDGSSCTISCSPSFQPDLREANRFQCFHHSSWSQECIVLHTSRSVDVKLQIGSRQPVSTRKVDMKLPIASQPVVFVSVPAVFSLTAILTAKSQHEAQRKTVLTCIDGSSCTISCSPSFQPDLREANRFQCFHHSSWSQECIVLHTPCWNKKCGFTRDAPNAH